MKIVADANLYCINELFGDLGDLVLIPGREINHSDLIDADALIVRSVTDVSAELLKASPVRFVGTATSGIDHIDVDFLSSKGVYLADAKGSNASAVVEYCFAALGELGYFQKLDFKSLNIGIIGYGAIGSLFSEKLSALGIRVKINDPPLQEVRRESTDPNLIFSDLADLCDCDIISVHTPLILSGKYPTKNLINKNFLKNLKSSTLLINTCRGGVIDEKAVLELIQNEEQCQLVCDVWENEPFASKELVSAASIATPHIAGYSQESKYRALTSLRQDFIKFFTVDAVASLPFQYSNVSNFINSENGVLNAVLEKSFSIHKLSNEFKTAILGDSIDKYFELARKNLLARRECSSLSINYRETDGFVMDVLNQLGVKVI